ncbi:phosphoribosylformylglycinamidine synthase subunit PurQ [bacterium]|nr:phosphoribosylformylglycinamidine synthase subunit PurQ [bacterium]NUN44225.1 phosphoribosylformylglycinamidine synthase subunit PurQ [bacterium]HNB09966.1 phosphoribosylformylglycinamidine synthase subunit PurQ [bacterium]HNE83654.1 phosphoribosylformylglycinamidine synthase subunit PurQ [bacterium]HNH32041.1 phosphoribosylformylglycinamidine synthase subunit PurQ [bacterium]
MKTGVVVFPGSNCDHDAFYTAGELIGHKAEYIWHKDRKDLRSFDLIIVPGGFSYGDYLRTGAIARFAPIMQDVMDFAKYGGTVFGVCNGFQILTEAGLLPGALLRNSHLHYVCKNIYLRAENDNSRFTNTLKKGEVLMVPIAHGEGNYFADNETLKRLEGDNRVLFRYCTENGTINADGNPNGSLNNIAGIMNENGNVAGMMPHPERCADPALGQNDGLKVFESLLIARQKAA